MNVARPNSSAPVPPMTLRLGSRGEAVRHLQKRLGAHGYWTQVDGVFGPHVEAMVCAFQRRAGVVSDGVVGRWTWLLLDPRGNKAGASRHHLAIEKQLLHLHDHLPRQTVTAVAPVVAGRAAALPAAKLSLSEAGLSFIFVHEAWKGVSNHLHWPKGASGVTLGPGYDMKGKERTAAAIESDMLAIGLTAVVAKSVGAAAGLTGADADKFCSDNKKLVDLTAEMETQLLKQVVPPYEKTIRNRITIDLLQHEFDALVSFAYNPGGRLKSVCTFVNQGKTGHAMAKIGEAVKSGGITMDGLVKRRAHEVALYTTGVYAKHPT
jgi:GH24 family phage-related lysozyme (muramidase)